jgi:hypothetical protein
VTATLGEQLSASGWKSGSVIEPACCDELCPYIHHCDQAAPETINPEDWLIVVSQSCDVVAPKDDAEPYVEVLCAHPLGQKKPRTQYCDLRSTRYLDFRPDSKLYVDLVLTAHATIDRYFVPKRALIGKGPCTSRTLSPAAVMRLQQWLALRASRPAWPDNFVHRVRPARNALEEALNPLRDDIAEVRVALAPNDRELADGEPYKVAVFFVVGADVFQTSPDLRGEVQRCFQAFTSVLSKCQGILVDGSLSNVIAGDQFTWEETRSSDLWDFANLSPLE